MKNLNWKNIAFQTSNFHPTDNFFTKLPKFTQGHKDTMS